MSAAETLEHGIEAAPLWVNPELPRAVLEEVRQQDFQELRDQTLAHMREYAPLISHVPHLIFAQNIKTSEQAGYGVLLGGLYGYKLVCEIVGDNTELLNVSHQDLRREDESSKCLIGLPLEEKRARVRQEFLDVFMSGYPEVVDVVLNHIKTVEASVSAMSLLLLYRHLFTRHIST